MPGDRPEPVLRRLIEADRLNGMEALLPDPPAEGRWSKSAIRELLDSAELRPTILEATGEARQLLFSYLNQCGTLPRLLALWWMPAGAALCGGVWLRPFIWRE